ncbi:MAG: TetR/AcrR family transcriptional regulator [candidate division Zixibacteria bacterium]|nr:TetR/AcrR family transcriptional regulator [candidate division Zixibacteria bacterium]
MPETNPNKVISSEPDSSKDRIIKAALEEFSNFGLNGARVDRIAQKAQINKAMIYYYFSSKENLYSEAVKTFFGSLINKIKDSIDQSGSANDTLNNISDAYAEIFIKNNYIRPIMLRELADSRSAMIEKIAQILQESHLISEIRSILEEGVKKGILRPVNLNQAIVSFVTMNIGYFIIAPIIDRILKIDDREEFLQVRKKAVVDLFFNGMKVRQS